VLGRRELPEISLSIAIGGVTTSHRSESRLARGLPRGYRRGSIGGGCGERGYYTKKNGGEVS